MSRSKSVQSLTVDWKAVGRRIRELRGFEVKQAEFAEMIGIGQSHISAIERGVKEPGAVVLYRIGRLYGKTVEWLLTGKDE
jgi:transcriptional regulator with XRE-family HTH domain